MRWLCPLSSFERNWVITFICASCGQVTHHPEVSTCSSNCWPAAIAQPAADGAEANALAVLRIGNRGVTTFRAAQ
jgi:hypothetical protein